MSLHLKIAPLKWPLSGDCLGWMDNGFAILNHVLGLHLNSNLVSFCRFEDKSDPRKV